MDIYRTRKQIIIVVVFFVLLFGLGGGIYYLFLKPVPSCFDNIKNQDEEDIDCGGICQSSFDLSCEIKTLKNPDVIWTKAVVSGDKLYDLVARVKNVNSNYGTSFLKYNFIIKGAGGQAIGQRGGNTFILPNSTKYIIENNFESSSTISHVDLEIDQVQAADWQKLKDYQALDLLVENKNFNVTSEPYNAKATGVVKNNTSFGFDMVYVNVVLFGTGQDNVLGVSRTELETVNPSETRYFSVKWFRPIQGEVKSIDMQAETNLFSDENYMRVHGQGTSGY